MKQEIKEAYLELHSTLLATLQAKLDANTINAAEMSVLVKMMNEVDIVELLNEDGGTIKQLVDKKYPHAIPDVEAG